MADIIYPASVTTDQEKLFALYPLMEQMRLEHNRVGAIARENWDKNKGKWATYVKLFTAKYIILLQERNKLRDAILAANYTREAITTLSIDNQGTIAANLFGDEEVLKLAETKVTTPLLEELKAIDFEKLEGNAADPYEDFTTYTKVDTSYFTVTATKITITNMSKVPDRYIYKDFGAGYFGDFSHLLTIKFTYCSTSGCYAGFWAVTNTYGSRAGMGSDGLSAACQRTASEGYCIRIYDNNTGTWGYTPLAIGATRYLKIERSGSTLTLYQYTDEARTNLETYASFSCSTDTYRYIEAAFSLQSGSTPYANAGLENSYLDIQAVSEPTVTTEDPSLIDFESALGNGNIENDNDDPVVEIGFDYGTESGVYTGEVTQEVDPDIALEGTFSVPITGLDSEEHYYYRAKARNGIGWGYGNEVEFDTPTPLPKVTTLPPSHVSESGATLNGDIESIGGESCDKRGFVYGTTHKAKPSDTTAPGDTGYDDYTEEPGTFSAEEFDLTVSLTARQIYYYRAYAHNSYGYDYGPEIMFFSSANINICFPSADSSHAVRFSSRDPYPTPAYTYFHWALVLSENSTFTDGTFGSYAGDHIYEASYYNTLMKTDLFTLTNPYNRNEGIIKVKWKAKLFQNAYPYGNYERKLYTHSTTYTGTKTAATKGGAWECEVFTTNPNTGEAWTIEEVDALIAGVSLGEGGGWGRPMLDCFRIFVLWVNASVATNEAIDIGGGELRLNGLVTEDEFETCQVYFEYGPDTEYGSTTTPETKAYGESFSADVAAAGVIHYRAVIETACGETFYGSDRESDAAVRTQAVIIP